jgi:hypothetical protein
MTQFIDASIANMDGDDGEQGIDADFIDGLSQGSVISAKAHLSRVSSPTSPFKGKTAGQCWELLQERRGQVPLGVETEGFIVVDERSLIDDTVLVCQAVKDEDDEESESDDGAKDDEDEDEDDEERFTVCSVRVRCVCQIPSHLLTDAELSGSHFYRKAVAYGLLLAGTVGDFDIEEVLDGGWGPHAVDQDGVLRDLDDPCGCSIYDEHGELRIFEDPFKCPQ